MANLGKKFLHTPQLVAFFSNYFSECVMYFRHFKQVSILGRGKRFFFSSLKCVDQLWGLPSLLFSGYRGISPRE